MVLKIHVSRSIAKVIIKLPCPTPYLKYDKSCIFPETKHVALDQ